MDSIVDAIRMREVCVERTKNEYIMVALVSATDRDRTLAYKKTLHASFIYQRQGPALAQGLVPNNCLSSLEGLVLKALSYLYKLVYRSHAIRRVSDGLAIS
jgi:hypothetical protein